MNNYIQNRKSEYEEMKKNQEKFERFCTLAFAKNTLILEESEKKHFQELREIEGEDYKFRKKIFWPI